MSRVKQTCSNCFWARERPKLGCYFNYKFREEMPKVLASQLALCMDQLKEWMRKVGAEWQDKKVRPE